MRAQRVKIFFFIALALGMVLAVARPTQADTITQNTAGLNTNTFFPGNSLTTPGGGEWDNITFNWFSDAPGTTPTAFGTLFLLTQEYLGTPAALSGATLGFLAQSQSISGGKYLFASGVTLQPNTRYFFYANAAGSITGNSDVPSENLYFSFSSGNPFGINPLDANYRLEGQVAVPEPATLTLLALSLAGVGARRWRQRRA